MKMQIGMLGLGRMGANMARRLMRAGHACAGYDRDPAKVAELVRDGAAGAGTLDEFVAALTPPRIVWVMLPAGDITAGAIRELAARLAPRDIVIDGGNSHYTGDRASDQVLRERGIEFVDCGTSGGVWGLERGYCLMIGGRKETVQYLDPIFQTLAPGLGAIPRTPGREALNPAAEHGYLYCGPAGAGHFTKMVHNGIEYGIMQSYAEGFDVLSNAVKFGYELPLADIAEVWRRGSVISSWLLDLSAMALAKNPDLAPYEGTVADSGEGRWTVEAAVQSGVPCPVLSASLYARFRSRLKHTFADKLLSAMRFGFGGHLESTSRPGQEPAA
jgi:6-phosphogluconate dehydrogenase